MPTDHNITAIQLPNGDKCQLPNKVKYIDITKSGSTYSLPSGTTYTSIKALIDADYICVVRVDSPGNETDGKIHLYLCNYLPTDSSSPNPEWDVGLFFESPTPYSGEAPFQIKIGTDNSVVFSQHSSGGYLSNLSDVDISGLANGQILVYNSTSQKWENSSSSETPLQYEYVGNKVNSINPSTLTDYTYPTTKAVHDYIVESSVYTITGFWDSNTYGSPIVQYSKDDLVLDLYDGIIYKIEDDYGTKSQTPYYTPYDGQVIFAERDNAYYYAFPSNTQTCKVKAITKGDIYCDYVNDNNNSTYILGLYVSVCDSFGCITLDSTNSTSDSYDLLVGAKHDDSTGQYTDVYGSVHTFIIYNNKSSDVDFTLTPSSPCDSSGLDANNTFTVPSNGKAEISILFEGDGSTRFYYSNLSFIVKTDFEIGTY